MIELLKGMWKHEKWLLINGCLIAALLTVFAYYTETR